MFSLQKSAAVTHVFTLDTDTLALSRVFILDTDTL